MKPASLHLAVVLRRCSVVLGVFVLSLSGLSQAAEVQVAVAANFTAPMKRIAEEFEKDTGHKAVLSYGATGRFYAQITNGAPFEVFLSADNETPVKLEKDGAAVAGTSFTYATGRLVLWSAKPGLVDEKAAVLVRNEFRHLAIAAPKLGPYGAAAMETMTKIGMLPLLQAKLVTGESIGQTFSMISSGNAELGFVAMSQVFEDNKLKSGSAWLVPAHLHSPIQQNAVLLARGKNNPAALQLLTFMKSGQARAIMNAFGYE
ncbi:MAG: molybdate ABC transporter substrate-binding protein [Polaromonas sp.]|jgi:molybdate transport system substrate-binding protein